MSRAVPCPCPGDLEVVEGASLAHRQRTYHHVVWVLVVVSWLHSVRSSISGGTW